MKRFLLIAFIFFIANTVPVLATISVTVSTTCGAAGGAPCAAGYSTTLTATVSHVPTGTAIGGVAFYDGASYLGSSNTYTVTGTTYTYTFPWTFSGTGAITTHSITATVLGDGGAILPAYTNNANSTVMDMVGNTSSFESNAVNPVGDASLGEQSFGAAASSSGNGGTAWIEGDNQFCSLSGWPYNGMSTAFPDGSCEWSGMASNGGGKCSVGSCSSRGVCSDGTECMAPKPTPVDIATSSIDAPDDVMHTMSDFITFSNSIISQNTGTLSSTFSNWYTQAATWIAPSCSTAQACTENMFDSQLCNNITNCNTDNVNGRMLNIFEPAGYPALQGAANAASNYAGTADLDVLGKWNTRLITPWLNNVYTSPKAWCVPPETVASGLLMMNGGPTLPTYEDAYITNNSSKTWGDLSHVIACMNYNGAPTSAGYGAAYNYQQCLNALTSGSCPTWGSLTTSPMNACDPSILGRSLNSSAYISWCTGTSADCINRCNVNYTNNDVPSFAKWVKDSYSLYTYEAPKFTTRSAFLTDIYSRAQTMQKIFTQAHASLANFFKTCTGCADGSTCNSAAGIAGKCADGSACGSPLNECEDGGPAAQLIYAHANPLVVNLPNAVIYGWVDNKLPNGKGGYAHIVKATAYSPGRQGVGQANATFVAPLLPWINTWETWALRKFALANRDGYVYVSIKRWDEDHANTLTFPNNHTLWQFLFHSPGAGATSTTGQGLITQCNSTYSGTAGATFPNGIGFGLMKQTVAALNMSMVPSGGSSQDSNTVTYSTTENAFLFINILLHSNIDRSVAIDYTPEHRHNLQT